MKNLNVVGFFADSNFFYFGSKRTFFDMVLQTNTSFEYKPFLDNGLVYIGFGLINQRGNWLVSLKEPPENEYLEVFAISTSVESL